MTKQEGEQKDRNHFSGHGGGSRLSAHSANARLGRPSVEEQTRAGHSQAAPRELRPKPDHRGRGHSTHREPTPPTRTLGGIQEHSVQPHRTASPPAHAATWRLGTERAAKPLGGRQPRSGPPRTLGKAGVCCAPDVPEKGHEGTLLSAGASGPPGLSRWPGPRPTMVTLPSEAAHAPSTEPARREPVATGRRAVSVLHVRWGRLTGPRPHGPIRSPRTTSCAQQAGHQQLRRQPTWSACALSHGQSRARSLLWLLSPSLPTGVTTPGAVDL